MRVTIFTPVSRSSAIGRVSMLVGRALRELGHEVVFICTEDLGTVPEDMLPTPGPVSHWTQDADVRLILETTDVIVHQVGDNYRFHVGSLEWLDKVGGIVCLHDFFIGGLFVQWSEQGHQAEADRIMQEWYGKPLEWYYDLARNGKHISGTWPEITFGEWVASKA
ncbi:MAG: hypothetical protein EPN91_12030, partial [Salinibacterium sp.]